ncbi:MAG: SCP2 sterol-binding domain-containing protein [Gammaproteobacteria bacterium]|nr:SCP2 sterol-binding domain-containing protein [Gammaproteobacteria bacterium]
MDLSIELARRFKTEAAAHADTVFRLATDRGTLLVFSVRAGEIEFEPDASPDVTFTFDRAETARAIILGDADPMDAFMAGRFRSDGHLPLAFVLLGLFRQDFGGPPPD